ncbi:MAG: hypothetical protein WD314_00435 [Trueperaceae bacterium]
MAQGKLTLADRETALLDLLAGWLEMVESCRDAGELPRDEFDKEFFGDIVPGTYEEWREHYTEEYQSRVDDLYVSAGSLVMGDEEEEPTLSPAEFLRQRVLPLFEDE